MTTNGNLQDDGSGWTSVTVFVTQPHKALFLQIGKSPLKRIRREVDDASGYESRMVESFESYFPGSIRPRFLKVLSEKIEAAS